MTAVTRPSAEHDRPDATRAHAAAPRFRTPASPRRAALSAAAAGAVFAALCLVDRPAYLALHNPAAQTYLADAIIKAAGTVYPWLAIAAVMALAAIPRARAGAGARAFRPAALLVSSSALAGGAAEVLKLILRRERPILHDGFHVYRSLAGDRAWHSGGLDLPSSHAAVAFGAAFALCVIAPRLSPLWVLIGVACAAQRVVAGAHFVSSVFLAGALAYASVTFLCRAGAAGEPRARSGHRGDGA